MALKLDRILKSAKQNAKKQTRFGKSRRICFFIFALKKNVLAARITVLARLIDLC